MVAQVEKAGRRAVAVEADLADLGAVAGLAEAALRVRPAGHRGQQRGRRDAAFLERRPGTWRRPLQRLHAHALTRAALPLLLESGRRSVVNISSVMGRVSGRGCAAYGTAKAALSHYTRLAARDLAPRVRVNAIGVGSVATSALDIVLDDESLRTTMEDQTPLSASATRPTCAGQRAVPRLGLGSYLTGKVLEADGGLDQPNLDLGLPDL